MATTASGSYDITLNKAEKKVFLYVSGKAEPDAIQGFFDEYNNMVAQIQPAEYELVVDCKEMQVVSPDMTEKLAASFELYKSTGFKKVIFEASSSIIKMQLNRIARQAGLSNAEVIEA